MRTCHVNTNTIKNVDKVWIFIWKRIMSKKYYKRPLRFRTLIVAKATGLTYKQVRNAIDILVANGFLIKYTTKHPTQFKQSFFQIGEKYITSQEKLSTDF